MSRKGQLIMKITPETTYKTLKTMVPDASAEHTPKGESLIRSDSEILIKVKEDSATIIVYKNGFFAYIDDQGEVTARAVANCRVMKFEKAEGGYEPVKESVFENLPFPAVLSHFGADNITHKKQVAVGRHENLSLDAEELPNDARLTVPNFADELDLDGEGDIWEKRLAMLPDALDRLTDRQREVVTLHYIKKKTHRDIAGLMGIGRSTVEEHIEAALKKLHIVFQKYPCK
jgi:DNA-binding CsgD family transcriptional regulator